MNLFTFKKSILLFICCSCFSAVFAQIPNSKIESYFQRISTLHQLNGNLLLANDNQVVFKGSFGYADFEKRQSNRPDYRFNLASISKLFTSTAILQLKDKGKLALDDHLVKYLPDFPFRDVTIRHLLTHTSGLPDLELFEVIIKKYPDTVITNKNIIPELKKWTRGLNFKPGDRYEYCNLGYSLLAILVEKIEKMPFQVYLQRYVFQPAGMKDTYVSIYPDQRYSLDNNCVKMHVQPHPYYDSTYLDVDSVQRYKYTNYNCSGTIGESNVITTAGDLLRFDQAFFAGRLLKAATIEEALTPFKLNSGATYYDEHMDTMAGEGKSYLGLGWEIFEQPGYGKSVGHGGYKFGLATFYFRNLRNKQTIIAFDNTAGSEFGRIITSSLNLLNGKEPLEIRTKKSLAIAYGTALVKQGIDAAASRFNLLKSDTAHYYLNEWEFNQLGGSLFYGSSFPNHQSLGMEVFKINTLLFPDGFNTYDSYAEVLRATGKREEAIAMYEKSIALNPNNDDGKAALKELLAGK
jgi:CubicO group peptidase (beta-lactamase class C family)